MEVERRGAVCGGANVRRRHSMGLSLLHAARAAAAGDDGRTKYLLQLKPNFFPFNGEVLFECFGLISIGDTRVLPNLGWVKSRDILQALLPVTRDWLLHESQLQQRASCEWDEFSCGVVVAEAVRRERRGKVGVRVRRLSRLSAGEDGAEAGGADEAGRAAGCVLGSIRCSILFSSSRNTLSHQQ